MKDERQTLRFDRVFYSRIFFSSPITFVGTDREASQKNIWIIYVTDGDNTHTTRALSTKNKTKYSTRLLSYTNRNDSLMFRSFYYFFSLLFARILYDRRKEKNIIMTFAPWLFQTDDKMRPLFAKGIFNDNIFFQM